MGGNRPRPDIEQGTGVRFETSTNRNNTVELSKADKDLQDLRHGVGEMSDKRELSTGSSTSIMFPIVEEHVKYDTEQR